VGSSGCGAGAVPSKQVRISKGLVSCAVLDKDKVGQGLGALCGSILHPSFSLVLGFVLRERIKSKELRSKDNKLKLDIPYTLKL
jgi:hypothetical protein